MRDTMRSSQQPSRSIVSIQRGLSSVLIFTLAFAVACTKKEMPPSQATSTGPSHRNEPGDISYLPQDIFGPQAAAGATELKPVDIRSLSDTELKYGIAPIRFSWIQAWAIRYRALLRM